MSESNNASAAAELAITPLTAPPRATVRVPGSKSITNRALVLAALHGRGRSVVLRGALRSEDTEVMADGLRRLGFDVAADWDATTITVSAPASGPIIPATEAELYLANSGTSMRFLTAVAALGRGRYRLDGTPRMRERPIADLLEALQQAGVKATSEADNGCPPVVLESPGLVGGRLRLRADVSSQFLSGLLLAASAAPGETILEVDGPLVSFPYVAMTLALLQQWGLLVEVTRGTRRRADEDDLPEDAPPSPVVFDPLHAPEADAEAEKTWIFHVPGRQTSLLSEFTVEPDATAASYFFGAAAIAGGEVTVAGLGTRSLQGDVRFVDVLQKMGCGVERGDAGITVRGGPLRGVDVDMNDISDCVMTLAAVACFAQGATTIRNVGHIRHKETDRLKALATEMRKLGAKVWEYEDGLTIFPEALCGATVDTYDDHRMAMSLALVGLRQPGVVIRDPGCVGKTYPNYFADLDRLR